MDMPLVVENAAATAACGHRRLLGLQLNKLGATISPRSSICSSPSSVAAAELESRVRSPNGPEGAPPLNSLESSYKIAPLEEQSDLGSDMSPMSYSDSTSTSSLATPNRASSPDTPAITTPANSSKLDGMMSPALASISSLHAVASAASTKGLSSLCPPHSSLLLSSSSSCSSSSSTSGSSEHSSYSATHGSKKPSSSLTSAEGAPQHGKKRGCAARSDADAQAETSSPSPTPTPTPTPTSTAASTSTSTTASLRPLGPAHLEHTYHNAHKSLSHALAIAAYELFGFSVPVRNAEIEARRPGRDAIPLLRLHPLVRRAAREVDRADAALERALARGETFENTPVPEEWRWGSEYLRPYEWARLEPECVVKKERRSRSTRGVAGGRSGGGGGERETSESGGGLRTRAQKRKAACEADGREEDENGSCSSVPSSSTAASSTMSDIPSSSSPTAATTVTDSSITPTPEKRKRGRPRKHPLKAPSTASQPQLQIQLTIATTAYTSVTHADPDPAILAPVKRKPGRPRKSDLPPALPSSSIPPRTAAPGHALRPTKRRRVTTS